MEHNTVAEYESSDDESPIYNLVETNKIYLNELFKLLYIAKLICLATCTNKTTLELKRLVGFDKKHKYSINNKGKISVFNYIDFDEIIYVPTVEYSTLSNGENCIVSASGEYLCDETALRRSCYLINNQKLTNSIIKKIKVVKNFNSKFIKETNDIFHYNTDDYTELNKAVETLYNMRILLNSLAYIVCDKQIKIGNIKAKDKLWELENTMFPVTLKQSDKLKYNFAQFLHMTELPVNYCVLLLLPPNYSKITTIDEINIDKLNDVNGYVYYENLPIVMLRRSILNTISESIYAYQDAIRSIANMKKTNQRSIKLANRNATLKFSVL